MQFHKTALDGVILVEPTVHGDERGYFLETYHHAKYVAGGIEEAFVQDNQSKSKCGTLRGLHAQERSPQGKLVRAVDGDIFDVAVDVRLGSPTFGQWVGEMLTAENFRQLYVPPGFIHGFCVISESAQVAYKCTTHYNHDDEFSVLWNDPDIGIEWPVDEPILSNRDSSAKRLRDMEDRLPTWRAAE